MISLVFLALVPAQTTELIFVMPKRWQTPRVDITPRP